MNHMTFILSLLLRAPHLIPPGSWIGWVGFVLYLAGLIFWLQHAKKDESSEGKDEQIIGLITLPEPLKSLIVNSKILFALLLIITPAMNLYLGVRLPIWGSLPIPGLAIEPQGSVLMVFAAIPWVLAAGILGPFSSIVLGSISGLILGYWGTNSPFTIYELAILAGIFAFFMQQRYRTRLFRMLRQPIFAAFVLTLFYPFLYILDSLLLGQGSFVSRLDFAFSSFYGATIAVGGTLIIASVFAQIIKQSFPNKWGGQEPWKPAPMETSLEKRFVFYMVPLAVALILTLMIGDWIIAGKVARAMLVDRMQGAAEIAAEGIPYFLDSGQSLINGFARDPFLNLQNPNQLQSVLENDLRTVPYFRVLFIADKDYQINGGYPTEKVKRLEISPEERAGIDLAYQGVVSQVYTIPPSLEEKIAQVSFLSAIFDQAGETSGVLIGRVDLSVNSFSLPIIRGIQDVEELNGEGMILDEYGRVIYNTGGLRVMEPYGGELFDESTTFEAKAHDGTRNIVYFQPAIGRPWSIVLSVPARRAQDLALQIATPLLGMAIILSLLALLILRYGLGSVTFAIKKLAGESDRIAEGDLDHSLVITGSDEIGQLGVSFEKMRSGLKSRIEELNLLLEVSRSIASSMEMDDAVFPILEAILSMGACSARIVLEPDIIPNTGDDSRVQTRFGRGLETDLYGYLDTQILEMTREQDRVLLTNPARTSFLAFGPGTKPPKCLLALALKHENQNYGAMWIVYDKPHEYKESEIRFLTTLASQAALAASNMQLYLSAEIGRQRLAAILSSTADPILVTNQQDMLILANPAAEQILGHSIDEVIGQSIDDCIPQSELLLLLKGESDPRKEPVEISLEEGPVFMGSTSPIFVEEREIGKVCVLRDVSHFKELDSLKSDFVSTVSHDLRSPLTLIRGYATMLDMVGDLNEQQTSYNKKIIIGVERMFRLINNLLDLGRIEADVGLQIESVRISEIVDRVVKSLAPQALQKRIDISVEINEGVSQLIDADPALLQQALYNLVENAIRYSQLDGKIWVRATQRESFIIFEVEDNGVGISPVDQPRVFDKFYRVSQGEDKRERGTGLGLAIVKSIAERHGGRVALESQLGKGSTFYLALPIHQPKKETKPTVL